MKSFTIDLINSFKISKELVHVGLAQFSSSFQHEFYLDQFFNEQAIGTHINKMQQLGGGTNIGLALNSIRQYFEASRGGRRAEKISQNLVLITDGESQDDVEEAARLLRAQEVEVFAIGIGNAHDLELLQIAGSPERVFTVKNFANLKDIQLKVVDTICKSTPISQRRGETQPGCVCVCAHTGPTELLLFQAASSTLPWALTSPEGQRLLGRLWSPVTLPCRASCRRSSTTCPPWKVCAAPTQRLYRSTSATGWCGGTEACCTISTLSPTAATW